MRQTLIFSLVFAALALAIIGCQALGGGASSKPTVIIASPPSESVYSEGEQVVVQSTSTDPAGVTQVALLVDENVVHQDPSPVAQGQAQFSLIQSWTAAGVGRHTIAVRATNAQGGTSDSGIVVNVQQQGVNPQPTSAVSIATAVPLATATLLPTGAAQTDVPTNPAVTVVVTSTPVPSTGVPTTNPTCVLNSKFVADVTIPDGTIFVPNAVFTKTWRVQNNGTCAWDNNYSLVFVSGTQMSVNGIYPVPATQPGATADLVVPMTAPSNYGSYAGTWRIRNASGQLFGTNVTVLIKVPSPATAVPPTHTPPPTVAGCAGQPNDFDFTATATTINAGQSVTLKWTQVNNASAVYLSGGEFGDNPGEGIETPGNRTVSPNSTTTYNVTALCDNSNKNLEKSLTISVNVSNANFSGTWSDNFGTMSLAQNGTHVTGTFSISGVQNGTVDGNVNGNTLTGGWSSNGSSGDFQLVMGNNNNKTFTGSRNGTNQWCGARTGESFPSGCGYDGKWKTKFSAANTECDDMVLNQIDAAVTGTYCSTRTLSGNVSYNGTDVVLTGTSVTNGQQEAFTFYLPLFTSAQFSGNTQGLQWCGWRSNSSAPNQCMK